MQGDSERSCASEEGLLDRTAQATGQVYRTMGKVSTMVSESSERSPTCEKGGWKAGPLRVRARVRVRTCFWAEFFPPRDDCGVTKRRYR